MKKSILRFLSGLIIGALIVHFFIPPTKAHWEPALEEIDFGYFEEPIDKAIQFVNSATNHILNKNQAEANKELQNATLQLNQFKLYYLPLSNARQLIYDADRLFYFKDKEHSVIKLRTAQQIIKNISSSGGSSVDNACEEIFLKIDDLIFEYNQSTANIALIFKELFHRVNMMLVKGGLILTEEPLPEKTIQ